jgi:hypothetical protein
VKGKRKRAGKKPDSGLGALAALLEAAAKEQAGRSRTSRRPGRPVRNALVLGWRWRRQLAPLAVMLAVLWVGAESVGVARSGRTFFAGGLLLAAAAWTCTRSWLDRAVERAYAAVCLGAAGCWLAWVACVGLGPWPRRVWLVGGLLLGLPWWWHFRVRPQAAASAADRAVVEAAVDAGMVDADAVSADEVYVITTASAPWQEPSPQGKGEPAAVERTAEPKPAEPKPEVDPLSRAALDAAQAVPLGRGASRSLLRLAAPVRELPGGARSWTYVLPAGTPASVVAGSRRLEFASALGVLPAWLDLRRGSTEQMLDVWLASHDPWGGAPARSPLVLAPRRTSIWEPMPLMIDTRGEWVTLGLTAPTTCSCLIGGQRGTGKTNTAFNMLAYVMCDPSVRMWIADPKPDTKPIRALAYRTVGNDKLAMVAMLRELVREMHRKFRFLESIDQVAVDRHLTEKYPDQLQVDLLYIDELASFTMSSGRDPLVDEIVQLLTELLQLGRAAAVLPVLATQRPSSAVLPTQIRANVQVRVALRCDGTTSSNMVLGDGASGRGWNAADITAGGVAIVSRNGVFCQGRPPYLGDQAVDMRQVIAPYARQLRGDAGALPAAGASTVVASSPAPPEDCAGTVLRLLGERGEMSRRDLIEACAPAAERTVGDALARLVRDERVMQPGRGRYALPAGAAAGSA